MGSGDADSSQQSHYDALCSGVTDSHKASVLRCDFISSLLKQWHLFLRSLITLENENKVCDLSVPWSAITGT